MNIILPPQADWQKSDQLRQIYSCLYRLQEQLNTQLQLLEARLEQLEKNQGG